MGLGMTYIPFGIEDDEDLPPHPHRQQQPSPPVPAPTAAPTPAASTTVIDTLLERLTTLSNQLESAVELSSSLQAQHAAAQCTILVFEEKVSSLEGRKLIWRRNGLPSVRNGPRSAGD
jgi:hypothetical protein